jgi:hypothetical protein
MIQNTALDVAIGLILIYLMLSLLCTAINEHIASALKLRAHSLKLALEHIIDDVDIRERFYSHGMIAAHNNAAEKCESARVPVNALKNLLGAAVGTTASAVPPGDKIASAAPPARKHPPYISGMNFAAALIGSLNPEKSTFTFDEAKNAVDGMKNSKLKSALQCALSTAKNDLDQLKKNVANWFDDSMEGLTGPYKRHLTLISIIVGAIVVVSFNADTLHVARTLWNESDVRAHVSATATATAANNQDPKVMHDTAKNINQLHPLPMGWACDNKYSPCELGPLRFLGWLLTVAAVVLGAGFWFDVLSKFINIRGAGVKPARADSNK